MSSQTHTRTPRERIAHRKRKVQGQHCLPLLDASTPDVYRSNAFRITGLPVDATPREIKRRIDDLKAAEEIGDADEEHGHAFALHPPPTMEQIREAAHRLEDPQKRIVEEFFWFWPRKWGNGKCDPSISALLSGHKDDAFSSWQADLSDSYSSASAVAKHNLAVMYQIVALDSEYYALEEDLDDDQLVTIASYWRTSFKWWEELTDDEPFWSLVTERIRMLDDPRLTTGFARRMRTTFPVALDKINAMLAVAFIERNKHALAEQHIAYMLETHEGQDDVAGTMALVATPLLNRVQTAIEHARNDSNSSASAAHSAATNLLRVAADPIRILKGFLPVDDPQLNDACDAVANTCLQCHQTMLRKADNDRAVWDQAIAILKQAASLAASTDLKDELQEAVKNAMRSKQLAHPKIKQIIDLVERARTEPRRTQLRTLGKDVYSVLSTLREEVGSNNDTYRAAADLVAAVLRSLSVELINDGQQRLSDVFQTLERLNVLENRQRRAVFATMVREGVPHIVQFEERKWDCLIDLAIGIDFYDRGKELACSAELRTSFQNDSEVVAQVRTFCRQAASEIYSRRDARGLLFPWGNTRPAPPPTSVSHTSSSSSQNGCFVATAVYGSYDHPSVRILRYFRDDTLMHSVVGRAFVRMYYRVGPTLADTIGRHQLVIGYVRNILDIFVHRISATRRYRQLVMKSHSKGQDE